MKFVAKPNLPEKKVKTVIISGEYPEFCTELNMLGINTVQTSACDCLAPGEQYHADLQAIHINNNKMIILNECILLQRKLSQLGVDFEICELNTEKKYPKNVYLNALILDNKILCNTKTIYNYMKNISEKEQKILISVKQGYTKCSCAVVSNNAIITSDNGIYNAATKKGIDVLKISEGWIKLPGFNYGFIGGACGLIAKDLLAFCGDVKKHPDYFKIKTFCRNYGVNLYSLSNSQLTDIGGILPITEEC